MISTITRRAVLAAAIGLGAVGASAQDDAAARRFADNAKAALLKLEQGLRIVKPAAKSSGFIRTDWKLTGTPSMDVQRTDSILDPVRAKVELSARMSGLMPVPTSAEAEVAPTTVSEDFRIQAVYVPADGGWVMQSVRYFPKRLGEWATFPGVVDDVTKLFEVAAPAVAAPAPPRNRKAPGQ